MNDHAALTSAIAALESQRAVLGDAAVDSATAPLRQRLEALQAARREPHLKQSTVLFADIVGSTSLSERLDPEDLHALFNAALVAFTGVVEGHRGRVLQYTGDGLLAVFGAERAEEGDAERAVHAGLALLEAARRQGDSGVALRVGIHTGAVLIGGGVDADGGIRGMAVNVAARMEQTAPAGSVRISHDTYRQVRGVFDVAPQPPLAVKGVSDPLVTYLVLRAKPRAFRVDNRGVDGVEVRLVGRDAEWARLTAAYQAVAEDRTLALVTLVGDAGLGKSRLLAEFERWVDLRPEGVWWFRGRAQADDGQRPYGVLRELLCWRFSIRDSDPPDQARRKLAEALESIFGARADEQTALLGQLIGFDFAASPHIAGILHDGQQLRDRAFHAAAQYFRRLSGAQRTTVVVMLEDIHWADDGSLDFVNHLVRAGPDLPLLVLASARPTLFERRPLWGSGLAQHERLDIGPLPKRQSRELAAALLQRIEAPPPALSELIADTAEGNPFFMEELMQMLIDDGAIRTDGARWRVVHERLTAIHVPASLVAVLQARLDALPAGEKKALQEASIIGHVFWDDALARLDADAAPALPALTPKDLVRGRETSAFEAAREFVFKHHVLHQVTYDGVLKRHRRVQHRRIADWLVERCGERRSEHLGLIASHFERAGEAQAASGHWLQAAEQAFERFSYDTALAHADRALALADPGDTAGRYRAWLVREQVLHKHGASSPQTDALAELQALADRLGDVERSQVAERRARFLRRTGDFAAAVTAARRALDCVGADAPLHAARACGALGNALSKLGDYAEAERHMRDGLAFARASGDLRAQANLLANLGIVRGETGDPVGEAALYREAQAVLGESGDRFGEAQILGNLAEASRSCGDHAAAEAQNLEALRLCVESGNRPIEAFCHLNLALVRVHLGEPAAALEHAEAAIRLFRDVGDRWAESSALTNLGHALAALGRHAEAAAAYAESQALCDSIGVGHMALQALAGAADVALAVGDAAGAQRHVQDILDRLAAGVTLDGLNEPLRVRWSCWRVLQATGDARAAAALECAHAELQALAARLVDPGPRHTLLHGVPHHRAIMAAWAAREAPAGSR